MVGTSGVPTSGSFLGARGCRNTLLRPGLIMFHPELQAFDSGFAVLHSNLGKYNANTLCTAPLVHHGSLSIERVVVDRNT